MVIWNMGSKLSHLFIAAILVVAVLQLMKWRQPYVYLDVETTF
jgi:hypothetical protein